MKDFKFDLQLFAEGDSGDGDSASTETTAEGIETAENSEAGGSESKTPPADTSGEGQKTLLGKENPTVAEYDFKSVVPEGMEYDAQQAEAFSAIAKEMNLTAEQAQKLAGYGMEYANGMAAAVEAQMSSERAAWAEATKKELGVEFDRTLQQAGSGLEALEKAIPNLRAALDYTGAGNRVEVIKMLAYVGELTKEDTFRGFGANSGIAKSPLYDKTDFGLY